MKNRSVLVWIVPCVLAVMIVGCVKGIELPAPGFGGNAVVLGEGLVTLNWNGVAGATGYNLRLVCAEVGNSREVLSIPVPGLSFVFLPPDHGMPYGTYSWFVKALGDGKESAEAQGPGFSLLPPDEGVPVVSTGLPAAGQKVLPNEPILFSFEATPGEAPVPSGNHRGYIDSLTLLVGTSDGNWDLLEQDVTGESAYTWENPGLEWGQHLFWTVKACQGNEEAQAATVPFSTNRQLELTLSEQPFSASFRQEATPTYWLFGEPLYGRVKAYDPAIQIVQLFLQEDGYSELFLEYEAIELDTNSEFSFEFPEYLGSPRGENSTLIWMWAQGLGNDVKSDKKPFFFKIPALDMEVHANFVCCDGERIPIAPETTLCGPCTVPCGEETHGATVEYILSYDPSNLLDDGYVLVSLSQSGGSFPFILMFETPFASFTANEQGRMEFVKPIFFSFECEKVFSFTGFATDVHSEMLIGDGGVHSFTLDLEDPTATLHISEFSELSEAPSATFTALATLSFLATDTKCLDLEDICFDLFVEKGEGDFFEQLEWNQTSFTLGTGDHALTGEATYASEQGDEGFTAWATMVLYLSRYGMDGATLSADVRLTDCCDLGLQEGHPVEVSSNEVYVDNVFLCANFLDPEYFIQRDIVCFEGGTLDEQGRFWLPVPTLAQDTSIATLSLSLWEKEPYYVVMISGAFPTNTVGITLNSAISTESIVCTGFDVKNKGEGWISLYARPDVVSDYFGSTITFEASNVIGQTFSYPVSLFVDTKAPELTYVQGYTNGTASGQDDFVDFVLHEKVDTDFDGFAATLTVNNPTGGTVLKVFGPGEIVPLQAIPGSGFRIGTKGFSLPNGGTLSLEVCARDEHKNIGISTLGGGIAQSEPSH